MLFSGWESVLAQSCVFSWVHYSFSFLNEMVNVIQLGYGTPDFVNLFIIH